MKPHTLYETAMPRGDARRTDREMGSRSEGEIARRWRRPAATRDNLVSTGQLAPLEKGKAQLLAHDRVRPETADILLFDLMANLSRQRILRAGETAPSDRDEVVRGIVAAFSEALRILLVPSSSTTEQQAALCQVGGKLVRALMFVARDESESEGYPLFKIAA
jgi:hypothetical protein